MTKTQNDTEKNDLKQRALDLLAKKNQKSDKHPSHFENKKLLHELEVHQIELELQNEELIQSRNEAREVSDSYMELYDFSPTMYFTLSPTGTILKLNLNAAKLLGKDRQILTDSNFGFFVAQETKETFHQFLRMAFKSRMKQTCDVILTITDQPRYVQLTGIATEEGNKCLITLYDQTESRQAALDLQESEKRYRNLFENSPIPLWELDYTGINRYLAKLKQAGISDLEAYISSTYGEISKCADLIKLNDINMEAISLFEADSKTELLASYRNIFTEETASALINFLVNIGQKRHSYETEIVLMTLKQNRLVCILKWSGSDNQIMISTQDVTGRKKTEIELKRYRDHLEELVRERTEKLQSQKDELKNMNKLFIGREFRIKELRDEVKDLKKKITHS